MEPNMFENITSWLQQFAAWATSITVIIAALSAIFKPFRKCISWIFRKLYGEHKNQAVTEMKEMEKRLTAEICTVSKKVDNIEIERIRDRVLTFGSECRRGMNHSKEEFDRIVQLNEDYHTLLNKTNDENGVFDATFDYIMWQYRDHLKNNNFLDKEE